MYAEQSSNLKTFYAHLPTVTIPEEIYLYVC